MRHGVTYCPTQFLWKAVSRFTTAIQTLPGGEIQCLASQFLLEELISAPIFLLSAYLQSTSPTGQLDLSCMVFSGNSQDRVVSHLGLCRVWTEAAKLNFSHATMPQAPFIPELHAVQRASLPTLETVTSVQFEFTADPSGVVRMLSLLPNLQLLSASGNASRLDLEDARKLTSLLPTFSCLDAIDLSLSRLPSKVYNSFSIGLSHCSQLTRLHMPDYFPQRAIVSHTESVMRCTLTSMTSLRYLTYRSHVIDRSVPCCILQTIQDVAPLFELRTLNLEVVLAEQACQSVGVGELFEALSGCCCVSGHDRFKQLRDLGCVLEVPSTGKDLDKLIDYKDVTEQQRRTHSAMLQLLDSVQVVLKGSEGSTHVVQLSV